MKLGVVTIGQSPRDDIIPELIPFLPNVSFIEAGALDDEDEASLKTMTAHLKGSQLVSRLRDGNEIRLGKNDVVPRLERKLLELQQDVDVLLLLCTSDFPDFAVTVPLIAPERVIQHMVQSIKLHGKVGVLTPGEEQIAEQKQKWMHLLPQCSVDVHVISPYQESWRLLLPQIIENQKGEPAEMWVMDCLGYTLEMKRELRRLSGKPAILARSAVARVAAELLG